MIGKKTSGFFKKSSREQIQFVSCSIIVMNWEYNFSNSRDYVEVTNIVFLHADIREKQQEGIHNRTGSSGSCELSCHLLFVAIRVSLRWLVLHSKKYAKKTAKNGVLQVKVSCSIPQMTISRCRCFTVTCFIKTPIKYIIPESLGLQIPIIS